MCCFAPLLAIFFVSFGEKVFIFFTSFVCWVLRWFTRWSAEINIRVWAISRTTGMNETFSLPESRRAMLHWTRKNTIKALYRQVWFEPQGSEYFFLSECKFLWGSFVFFCRTFTPRRFRRLRASCFCRVVERYQVIFRLYEVDRETVYLGGTRLKPYIFKLYRHKTILKLTVLLLD